MDPDTQQQTQPTTPILDTQFMTPAQPNSQSRAVGKKKWLWAVVALILLVAFLFIPIPYHQNETICTMSYPSSTCSTAGWHIGPSLFTRIFLQLQQNSSQLNSNTPQQSIKSSDIHGFPIYPTAIFIKKDIIPPCSGEVSGHSTCDATTYLWQTTDDYDAVNKWYREDKSNSGWKCSGGAGWYDGPRNAYGKTACRKNDLAYGLFFSANTTKTEITLSISNKAAKTDTTANWKTYSTSKFSFKYPPYLAIKETDKDVFVLYQEGGSIIDTEVFLIDARLSGNNINYTSAVEKAKKEIVNAKVENIDNGVKISGTLGPGYGEGASVTAAYFKYNQGAILVETHMENKDKLALFDQILQTFKFTDKTAYTCPATKTIDCMPIVDENRKDECDPAYLRWVQTYCPSVTITQ